MLAIYNISTNVSMEHDIKGMRFSPRGRRLPIGGEIRPLLPEKQRVVTFWRYFAPNFSIEQTFHEHIVEISLSGCIGYSDISLVS